MPAPLSSDLRERVLQAYQETEESFSAIARRFKISDDSVRRYVAKFKERGIVEPEPHGGGMPAVIGFDQVDKLASVLAVKPDATLDQMVVTYKKMHGQEVTRTAMHRALVRFGISSKKKVS
jgi:transposase